jgi:hypothetical protein
MTLPRRIIQYDPMDCGSVSYSGREAYNHIFFYRCTVHLDITKMFHQQMHLQYSKETLKFTLKITL